MTREARQRNVEPEGSSSALIVRIWRTEIEPARAAEYESFAHDISLPMFRAQQGFLGVLFCRDGSSCAVISLWSDEAAIRRLAVSTSYAATVAAIEARGFLRGESSVEVWPSHGGWLPDVVD